MAEIIGKNVGEISCSSTGMGRVRNGNESQNRRNASEKSGDLYWFEMLFCIGHLYAFVACYIQSREILYQLNTMY